MFCFRSLPLSFLSLWPSFSRLEDQEPSHRLARGIKLLIIVCLCLSTLSMLGCIILFCMSSYVMLFCCRSVTTTAVNVILYTWFFSQCEIYGEIKHKSFFLLIVKGVLTLLNLCLTFWTWQTTVVHTITKLFQHFSQAGVPSSEQSIRSSLYS